MQEDHSDDLPDYLPGMEDVLALQRDDENDHIPQDLGEEQEDMIHPDPMEIHERIPLTVILRRFLRVHYTKVSVAIMLLYANYVLRTTKQIYITLVYLSTSKVSYIIFGNAIISLCTGFFYLVVDTFLDGLRVMETETIEDHLRWSIADTCFALTVFRPEINIAMIGMFLLLILSKAFHWAIDLRGNHLRVTDDVISLYPETNESVTTNRGRGILHVLSFVVPMPLRQLWSQTMKSMPWMKWSHVKFLSLCWTLLIIDLSTLYFCTSQLIAYGPSVYIYFGFEGAILLSSALSTITLFDMHMIDGIMNILQRFHTDLTDEAAPSSEHLSTHDASRHYHKVSSLQRLSQRMTCSWRENRATLSISIELIAQAAKFLFSFTLFATVLMYYGLPFSILRELYFSYQKLRDRLTSFASYRRLTRNMNERFESVQSDIELDAAGRTCIICRDRMDAYGVFGGCKKLPICGHIFHKHCLQEWLVQQQTCPTCRGDIQANEIKAKAQQRLSRAMVVDSAHNRVDESNEDHGGIETSIDEHEDVIEKMDQGSPLVCDDETESREKTTFPGLYRIVEPYAASIVNFVPSRKRENCLCTQHIKSLATGKIVVCTEKRTFAWTSQESASLDSESACFLRTPDGWINERSAELLFGLSS